MIAIEPVDAVGVLSSAYGGVMEAVAGLEEDSGWEPTRCAGWCVRDLLFHLYTDARRGLAALCTPVDAGTPVDRDWVSYWTDWQHRADPDQHGLRMVRISASAFSSLTALRDVHAQTARATVAVAHTVDPRSHASTQGHVLTAADLMITLAVEAIIHHMDLVVAVNRPGPAPGLMQVARSVVEGLVGTSLPQGWDDTTAVLVGTGRLVPTPEQRASLGSTGRRLPVFR